jgi:hypothetical protein
MGLTISKIQRFYVGNAEDISNDVVLCLLDIWNKCGRRTGERDLLVPLAKYS